VREEVGGLVGEVSRKAKKGERDFEFEHDFSLFICRW